jgi:hypothetical protein
MVLRLFAQPVRFRVQSKGEWLAISEILEIIGGRQLPTSRLVADSYGVPN